MSGRRSEAKGDGEPSSGADLDDASAECSVDSLLREVARIAPISTEPDRVGKQLGRYRIDETLGRGGMGIVYGAEDVELGRRVALKVLPRAAVADDDRRRRFLREARAAASLSHPNLAALFDVGEADGTVFLAMELVRGASLRATIAAAPAGMPFADAVRIALQIARGIGKAHQKGIVHRDLKPENVMIDADGSVKVVDFGLAKLAAPESGQAAGGDLSTQDGRILGTPSYMAPEQAKGARVLPSADVFSLGVVLYEMLTGERPFAGTSLVDVLVAIARDHPAPPSKRAPRVPRELDRIVLRCLAKEPSARFVDGDAVAAALLETSARTSKPTVPTWALAVLGALGIAAVTALAWPTKHERNAISVETADYRESSLPPTPAAARPSATTVLVPSATPTTPKPPAPSTASAFPAESALASARAPAAKPSAQRGSASGSGPLVQPPASASVDPLARQK